jgi:hypothetical protein
LDLDCPPKRSMCWSSTLRCWKVVETFKKWSPVGGFKSLGVCP